MPKQVGWHLTNADPQRISWRGLFETIRDKDRERVTQHLGYTIEPVYTLTDDERKALELSGAR